MNFEFYPTFENFFDENYKIFSNYNDYYPLKAVTSSSPREHSSTAYETESNDYASFEFEESWSSSSKSASLSPFSDTKFEEIIAVVNSPSTDLNLYVDDLLASEPADPNIKRKRNNQKESKRSRKSQS